MHMVAGYLRINQNNSYIIIQLYIIGYVAT